MHHAAKAARVVKAAPGRFLVLLDPGHGGSDSGEALGPNAPEKSAALSFAIHLRDDLSTKGIDVRLTRDSDTDLSPDQRGDLSSSLQPSACVSLHVANSASGDIHIFTGLTAPPENTGFTPWSQVQTQFLHLSQVFGTTLQTSLKSSGLPASVATASLPTLERFHCPAIAIEFTPATANAPETSDALTAGIISWRMRWEKMRAAE
jgi:N-acetylmuramoyl-L-alanine amidase